MNELAPILEAARRSLTTRLAGWGPEALVGLGSGLGEAAAGLSVHASISFEEIPGFVAPTVAGHGGRVVFGNWAGRRVMTLFGRMHAYEGHSQERVEFPIALAAALGVRFALLTNMSGGIRPEWPPGTLMTIVADKNLHFRDIAAIAAQSVREHGAEHYSPRGVAALADAAVHSGVPLVEGVYAGLLGPTYETPAEIRALRLLGADAVGMSTVIEARAAKRLGVEFAAVSCIANPAAGVAPGAIDHADVLAAAKGAAASMGRLFAAALPSL